MGLRQQRADANYFTVDGGSANFGVTGYLPLVQTAGGALPALSASGGTNSLVAVEELCPPQFTHVPFRVFGGEQQRRNLHCECWEYEQGKQGTDEQRQVNLIDNLSVVKRSHELKFGVDYRRLPVWSNNWKVLRRRRFQLPSRLPVSPAW